MQLPNIVHPKRFRSNGCEFEVVAYCKLTDRQAESIVRTYLVNHKLKKKDEGKVIKIVTTFGENNQSLLG